MAGIIVYSGDAEAAAQRLLSHPVEFTDNRAQFLRRIYQRYSPAVAGNVIRTTTRLCIDRLRARLSIAGAAHVGCELDALTALRPRLERAFGADALAQR